MSKQSVGHAVIITEYKGEPILGIWDVNANGKPVGKYPIVSFGVKKAEAILAHIEEIEEWVSEQVGASAPAAPVTVSRQTVRKSATQINAVNSNVKPTSGATMSVRVPLMIPRAKIAAPAPLPRPQEDAATTSDINPDDKKEAIESKF